MLTPACWPSPISPGRRRRPGERGEGVKSRIFDKIWHSEMRLPIKEILDGARAILCRVAGFINVSIALNLHPTIVAFHQLKIVASTFSVPEIVFWVIIFGMVHFREEISGHVYRLHLSPRAAALIEGEGSGSALFPLPLGEERGRAAGVR